MTFYCGSEDSIDLSLVCRTKSLCCLVADQPWVHLNTILLQTDSSQLKETFEKNKLVIKIR